MLKPKQRQTITKLIWKIKLEKLLENINGISKVSVVISFKSGSEKILQEDVEDSSGKEKNENRDNINASSKKSTVIFFRK